MDGKTGELGTGPLASKYNWWLGSDTAWNDGVPWWRPPAADFLAAALPAGAQVLEWGCGGSTIWLARLGYQVKSLELDAEWKSLVAQRLELDGLHRRAEVQYFIPHENRFEFYADHVLLAGDEYFDAILIDGRNRARCCANAQRKVKIGGYVLLDNSERGEYAAGIELYRAWPRWDWGDDGWLTTIWQRPAFWVPPSERIILPNAEA